MKINSDQRIPVLDGLRGLAIIAVLVWHYFCCQVNPHGNPILNAAYKLTCYGWSGVDLFFVLSGFLIGGILLDKKNAGNLLPVFYARRVLRIFPIYFVSLICFTLILYGGSQLHKWFYTPWLFYDPMPIWSYFLFLQNILMVNSVGANWLGPTWSLAVEEQFYLILPTLIRFTKAQYLNKLLISLIVLSPIIRTVLFALHNRFQCYVLLPCRWDELFMGVLLANFLRQPDSIGWLAARKKWLWTLFAILGAGVAALSYMERDPWSKANITLGYSWVGLFYLTLLTLALVVKGGALERVLSNRALCYVGRISYGLYVLHQVVLGLCFAFLLHQAPMITTFAGAGVTILALATTIIVASLSFKYFESPLLKLGHQFRYN